MILAATLTSIGCATTQPATPAPAAVKPVVDRIYALGQDHPGIASAGCPFVRYRITNFKHGSQLALFMTNLPYPSRVEVAVDGDILPEVPGSSPFSGPAYKLAIDATKTPTEWRVLVNPLRPAPFVVRVRNISANPNLTGKSKISDPAAVGIAETQAHATCGAAWIGRAVPGRWIAFTSNRTGSDQTWIMRGDASWAGADLRQLTTNGGRNPTIGPPSPIGADIMVAGEAPNAGNGNIFNVWADGSPTGSSWGSAQTETDPAFIDHDDLLYVVSGTIWRTKAAGFAQLTTTGVEAGPVVSPDGSEIAYVRTSKLWIMDADGTNQRSLTGMTFPDVEESPVYSPDGASIAFIRNGQLWVIPSNHVPVPGPNGTSMAGSGFSAHPSWSPDGRFIAVESGPHAGLRDIFRVEVATRQWVQLTSDGTSSTPVWSPGFVKPSDPDGYIAFISSRDGNREIYVMNTDGTGQRNLTNNPAEDFELVWR